MAGNLAVEFQKFLENKKKLKKNLTDTKNIFHDINSSSTFDTANPAAVIAKISEDEEEEITKFVDRPPCFIVLGQTCYAKVCVVNELFNQNILPPVDDQNDKVRWRMMRFSYGDKRTISLSLPDTNYEILDELVSYKHHGNTLSSADIELKSADDSAKGVAILDVRLKHVLLKHNVKLVFAPSGHTSTASDVFDACLAGVLPVVIYALGRDTLSVKDIEELKSLRKSHPDLPFYFVQVPPPLPADLTESGQHQSLDSNQKIGFPRGILQSLHSSSGKAKCACNSNIGDKQCPIHGRRPVSQSLTMFKQLCDLRYLSVLPRDMRRTHIYGDSDADGSSYDAEDFVIDSEFVEDFVNFKNILLFVRKTLQSYLVAAASMLNIVHTRCLSSVIMTAFDMQRDMMITPKRLEFAREKENELYFQLMEIASQKQDEIRTLIAQTITDLKDLMAEKATEYDFIGVNLTEYGVVQTAKDLKICTGQLRELVLGKLNGAIAMKMVESVNVLRDSYTGTLTRCLESLETERESNETNDVTTTDALKQIVNAAYQVEITVRTSSSVVHLLLEKMKQFIQSMPWKTSPKVDVEWRKKVVSDMLNSLSESKLAKTICSQFRDRLKNSHESFSNALKQLESKHSGRLERTEEQRLKVRKIHAPRVAKLHLDSTSLKDFILYGMPVLGREIGRGQYGVVHACEAWSGYRPCAIKSVVPPDEKHWNDLALEFYYTKYVPEHDRVVAIRGSVIDNSYGDGMTPAVYLVMDRMYRDLYTAIRAGLDWIGRLVVATDVVEGMRFLHRQGLVHRDIKLKNVLLDKQNRGKITDLGFCKPEAMMSGSIVGTPIHMAPELFSGRYDNSVDVYAFGILFWYVCAGHVRLPYNFEQCTSKDQLWVNVKKGLRPEKLPHFDDECWDIMQACWDGEPLKRPLLGNVEPQLIEIRDKYRAESERDAKPAKHESPKSDSISRLTNMI